MRERRTPQPVVARCKLVLVGDVHCGKTAMLQVLAKDCYPETYVPTVFENYTACLETEEQRVELSLWDTSGSPYYDNVRPLCYSDSDAVLLCFDWKTEILDYCHNTRVLLIGCKTDLRTDLSTLMELSHQKQAPVSYEQSVHSIFRTVASLCLTKPGLPGPPKSPARSFPKRLLRLPSRSELISSTFKKEKAKSCSVM
ncbi:Rho-related GTP-binding protein Rho6, partial [Ophiophagus hannah]